MKTEIEYDRYVSKNNKTNSEGSYTDSSCLYSNVIFQDLDLKTSVMRETPWGVVCTFLFWHWRS